MRTILNRIRTRIETVIQAKRNGPFRSLETVLYLLSLVYGGAVLLRSYGFHKKVLSARRLPCAVISIGNITVGGTGKTPMTIYVAKKIRDMGYSVAVISRGYKGKAEESGGIVSDGQALYMDPDEAGDEPFMMADSLRDVPVIVGQDRFLGGMQAVERFNPAVLILDDGFQHLGLMRDLDLVLLDNRKPFGNQYLLPRGPLRESIAALKRGDVFILTRCDGSAGGEPRDIPPALQTIDTILKDKPVFRSSHIPRIHKILKGRVDAVDGHGSVLSAEDVGTLEGRCVFAFSGIARNDDFRTTVEGLGCRLTGFKAFADHYPYRQPDLEEIKRISEASGSELILTTEKDAVRILDDVSWPVDLVVIGLEISFQDPGNGMGTFDAFLEQRLQAIV